MAFFAVRNYQTGYSGLSNANHNRVSPAMQKLVVNAEGIILLLLWTFVWGYYFQALFTRWRSRQPRAKREWAPKPRTPADCPTCRLEQRLAVPGTT